MNIDETAKQKMRKIVSNMDVTTMFLTDHKFCKGYHIPLSYFPTLAIIFKAMLLNTIDERPQKITVEFDDCTAYTMLDYSKRLDSQDESRGNKNAAQS